MKSMNIPNTTKFLPLIVLCAVLAFAAETPERKRQAEMDLANLKGRPDNSGLARGAPNPGAALPKPSNPPYEPVAMTARVGTTGLVAYSNTSGLAMIDPVRHVISPILLNEYDYTIDPETGKPVGGPLGSEEYGRYDMAMTSDGRQALIGNFADRKVFFVDLSSGTPVVAGMAQIDFYAEDIAIDPSNRWALVTDGGFSRSIAVLDIPSRAWVPAGYDEVTGKPYSMQLPANHNANAVAIAADGRTVVLADFSGVTLHVALLDPATGGLTHTQTSEILWKQGAGPDSPFWVQYPPINVAVSPDGRTVIAINPYRSTYPGDDDPDAIFEGCSLAVFTIDAPGHITRHPDAILPFRVSGGQSLVFSADGRRAYLHTLYWDDEPVPTDPALYWYYPEIQVLAVNGPGRVSHIGSMRSPSIRGTSQFYGVDILAITPDGGFLYSTNPCLDPDYNTPSPVIDVFNLRSQRHVKRIGTPTHYPDPERDLPNPPDPPDPTVPSDWIPAVYPVGIAFPAAKANRPPVAVIEADKKELFLDVPETATFDGSGSYDPEGSSLAFHWTLVSNPAGAAAKLTPDGTTARLTPDLPGAYQVGLVVNDGRLDSPMATAQVLAKYYPVLPPASPVLQRLESDLVFSKEYVNRLTWSANPDNRSTLVSIRIYRKAKGAGDAAYALLVSLPAISMTHDDRGLAADQLFTYRITTVNARGVESDPVEVSN